MDCPRRVFLQLRPAVKTLSYKSPILSNLGLFIDVTTVVSLNSAKSDWENRLNTPALIVERLTSVHRPYSHNGNDAASVG